jgi:4-amino-4-deoxy-L-arabinose transferase-like glycosyltransferase
MSQYLSWARPRLAVLIGLLLANLVILSTGETYPPAGMGGVVDLSWLRLAAGWALIFVLPGLAWLPGLNWLETDCGLERIVMVGGVSVAVSCVALLGAVYWPGPWGPSLTLIALDLVALLGVAFTFLRPPRPESREWRWPSRATTAALLVILCVAAFLRWYNIGYGEFHEDELENLRLAVGAMKGEEYSPFLDSKGPVHWLLPGALWLMHGWVNELVARSPFAISSLLTVVAVYMLGRRMAGPAVGAIGSGFVAVNGFLVAYARFVENPSLIVLWGALAAWCAYRFYREGNGWMQVLGALFLGIGLVAHPDVLLYLAPFGFMLAAAYWRERGWWQRYWKSALLGLLVFLVLTLAFYVPFVRDPNFQLTREYLASERIGTQLLYNNVAGMLEQDRLYSTRYYAPLLIFFSSIIVLRELRRLRWPGVLLAILLVVTAVSTVYLPWAWEWRMISLAFLPYAVLLLVLTFSPRTSFEVRSLALWFGIPFLGLQFLAKDAADHIQIGYPAWSLIAAMGLLVAWRWASDISEPVLPSGRAWVKIAIVAVLACILGLILYYQQLEFLGTVAQYWRAEADANDKPASIYRTLYGSLPRPRKLFGNPRLGGWKVVGHLYDAGQLQGDFRSINESFAVPIWYTHQTPRSCFNDPQNYFVRMDTRGEPEEMSQLSEAGYSLTRIVRVDHQPMLYLFEKGVPATSEPQVYDVDDYRAVFGRSATPQRYVQGPSPEHPVGVTFGGKLRLQGYDMPRAQLAPGETLALTLHWQALAPMDIRYRAFVHVESDRMWGQHDDDPVCRVRTDEWRPPQSGAGQFRVTLDPATPPGTYPVTVGIYDPESGERLAISDAQGRTVENVLELATITVE